ncbi:MAG: glycosyltransferase family 4 protein [Planctomycetaceae bacterium]
MSHADSGLDKMQQSLATATQRKPIVTFCSYDKPGNLGGPFSWLRWLLPLLRDRGLECRCLFLTHFGGTGPIVEGLRSDGFDCRVANCHSRMEDQVRWILEQLNEAPTDVFVPNLVVAAYHAARWVRACGIATVGILHSDDPYYRAIQDEFVFGPPKLRLTNLVCVSRELEEQVLLRRPKETTVLRIPYGVLVPNLSVRHSASRFRMAYVGRMAEEQKRISETTRALIQACQAIPNSEAVLFGDGPDLANVERILATEGEGAAIRLAGPVSNAQVQSELLQCDVIVLLSDYEGLPIALLEAMACGCVPVCLNMRSGIPELVQEGFSGMIVSDRDDSFLTALKRLASDVSLRQQLGDRARATVVERYSQNYAADRWAEHLHQLSRESSSQKILMPRRILLSRRNPILESVELRAIPPSWLKHLMRKARIWAGQVRRRLFPVEL